MKAEIKGYDCIAHDPIEGWTPDNFKDINIWIAFYISPINDSSADLFYANILTKNNVSNENQKYILIEEYDLNKIIKTMQKIIDEIEADEWDEFANKLDRYIDWEFSSYQE